MIWGQTIICDQFHNEYSPGTKTYENEGPVHTERLRKRNFPFMFYVVRCV